MQRIEAYVRLAIIFIIILTVLYLPILFYLKKRGKNIPRQLAYLGFICSIFLIVFATIFYTPITFNLQGSLNLVPFAWLHTMNTYNEFIVEKIPNILLFIPFGFFIPIVFSSKRYFYKTLEISFCLTFSIEFVQFFIGRSSDIDDVITNLLGAVIGYLFFKILDKLLANRYTWKLFTKQEKLQ